MDRLIEVIEFLEDILIIVEINGRITGVSVPSRGLSLEGSTRKDMEEKELKH